MVRFVTETVYDGRVASVGAHRALDDEGLSLTELLTWLQSKLYLVPPEYHGVARVRVYSDFDTSVVSVEVAYDRPETPEDVRQREAAALRRETATRDRELKALRELIVKYRSEALELSAGRAERSEGIVQAETRSVGAR